MSQRTASSRLTEAWRRRGPLACALWPVSALMGGIVALRRLAYRQGWLSARRLPVPVLVVGNRIAGGAGKTPTTIALLHHLRTQGWTPGVLSRGYGAPERPPEPLLLDAQSAARVSAAQCGDEPLLIWRRTGVPLMIGPDRAPCGEALLGAHPDIDILVCDDGLQHLRLQRDVEVIVFDERGAGNGWLLPAGPLREPWDSAPTPGLVAPPLVLYNAPRATTPLPGHLLRPSLGQPVPLADWWRGEAHLAHPLLPEHGSPKASVWALAGIAQPQRFFGALAQQGFAVQPLPLPDHTDFATLPWPESVRDLIVTEKDAVKLRPERLAAERPHTR
ncbi:tetraacyldisaccharide 4'-kinase, partial [Aquabacterium sp.]|uniref:tetraacyldisaccharide 4'-kinase n=1 Tax=Aquabacterium sp. TaxID=1872578 RepID=UPI0025C418F1